MVPVTAPSWQRRLRIGGRSLLHENDSLSPPSFREEGASMSDTPMRRVEVTTLTVAFDPKHQVAVVKFRLHDLSTATFHWHSTVAAFVHDKLHAVSNTFKQATIDLQPPVVADDWDGIKGFTVQGVEIHEYENGLLLVMPVSHSQGPEYFLEWEAAALLKHYLEAIRPALVDLQDPRVGGTRKH
jgi:hypothetical protein